jgi:hypothetical protein
MSAPPVDDAYGVGEDIRPMVARVVRGRTRNMLWVQGLSRHSVAEIVEFSRIGAPS